MHGYLPRKVYLPLVKFSFEHKLFCCIYFCFGIFFFFFFSFFFFNITVYQQKGPPFLAFVQIKLITRHFKIIGSFQVQEQNSQISFHKSFKQPEKSNNLCLVSFSVTNAMHIEPISLLTFSWRGSLQ